MDVVLGDMGRLSSATGLMFKASKLKLVMMRRSKFLYSIRHM